MTQIRLLQMYPGVNGLSIVKGFPFLVLIYLLFNNTGDDSVTLMFYSKITIDFEKKK